MEWTDEHDVLMLREMVVSDVFSFKKGSVSRGDAWDSIAEKLNQIDSPQFRIKDKRGVRERWVLLRRKFRSKIREEEAASGVVLIEREDTIKPDDNRLSVQQKNDKDKAEDIRKKAMESMGETKKRKLSRGTTDEDQPTTSGRKRSAQPLVDFLRENANAERELRQQELDIKRKEHEKQQETIQVMMLQQQKMNQAFISVVKKLLEK
ncbi:unnamed protein product [Porites lobata]|uniref:Uncharacterized protein n=1 Tax=Porites lobata TaxID=104759 RepID=A0ABN8RYG2_9CNID|nr:unnamed protein product [Porites lobata]